MGRCYGCCQENCGYVRCSCSCHDSDAYSQTLKREAIEEDEKNKIEDKKKRKDILERAVSTMHRSSFEDDEWKYEDGARIQESGNGEGHWVSVDIFVPLNVLPYKTFQIKKEPKK